MALTDADKDIMNRLYKEYGLTRDHIFDHKHYKIITRAGIDKIQANANIKVKFKTDAVLSQITNGVVFNVFGTRYDDKGEVVAEIQTTGEANDLNTSQSYKVAMAEKRGMSRAVLKLAGLYQEDFFSEDEADAFKESVNQGRQKAAYKGN